MRRVALCVQSGRSLDRNARIRKLMKGRRNMTTENNPSAMLKTYQDKIKNQVKETKTKLEELEAKAKEQKAQAEIATINRLRTTKETIDRKLQNLTTTGEANVAQAKADIDADVAKFKASVDELATKFKMHVTK
jgi:folylpolyglutamate synthase/dihydropteroate synthase